MCSICSTVVLCFLKEHLGWLSKVIRVRDNVNAKISSNNIVITVWAINWKNIKVTIMYLFCT